MSLSAAVQQNPTPKIRTITEEFVLAQVPRDNECAFPSVFVPSLAGPPCFAPRQLDMVQRRVYRSHEKVRGEAVIRALKKHACDQQLLRRVKVPARTVV